MNAYDVFSHETTYNTGWPLLTKLGQGATSSYLDELFGNDPLRLVTFSSIFGFPGLDPVYYHKSHAHPPPYLNLVSLYFFSSFVFIFPPSVLGSGPKSFGRRNTDFSDVLRLHQYRMVWHGLRMEGVLRSFERIYPMNPGYRLGEHCGSFFLSSSSG